MKKHNMIPLSFFRREILNKEISLGIKKKLSDSELAILFLEISLLLKGGIPLSNIIQMNITNEKTWKNKVFLEIKNDLLSGKYFSFALEKSNIFPTLAIGMIKIAEDSGTLEKTLEDLSIYYKNQARLKKKIINGLSYPILLIITCFIVVHLLFQIVIPIFLDVFISYKSDLPFSTQLLLNISNHLNEFGLLYYLITAITIVLILIFRESKKGKEYIDIFLLKLPIVSQILRQNFELFFIRSMCIQSKTNVDILSIISRSKHLTNNSYFKKKLNNIENSLLNGESIYSSLSKENIVSRKSLGLIQLGEESSRLGEILEICSSNLQDIYENKIEKFSIFIEPILILLMAGIVAFIVFSVAIPMFDIVNQF